MKRTLTVCPYCGTGCMFYLVSDGGKLVGVEPSVTHPVSRGGLCVKGWNAFAFVHHFRVTGNYLHTTTCGGFLHRGDYFPKRFHRQTFLDDKTGAQIEWARAGHGQIVHRPMHSH